MTNEEILEKQVEALEKLLQLRSAIIEDLEQKVMDLQNEVAKQNLNPYPYAPINVPNSVPWIGQPQYPWNPQVGGGSIIISNTCPDGTPHQYPSMWGGIGSPACTKCGQCLGTITSVSTSGYIAPVHTTGLVQPIDPNDPNVTFTSNVFTLNSAAK